MYCPKCKAEDTRVIDSRIAEEGRTIRRRRECEKCGTRFTTFERIELVGLMVRKTNDTTEPYSRKKLERGISLSCGKRPVTREQIDETIRLLEEKWSMRKEISSKEIGESLMQELKKLDHVAFIRFASIYRNFKDVEEFKKELSTLFNKNK